MDFFLELDKNLFLFLNGIHNAFFDVVMYWISDKYIWIPLYGLLLFLIIRQHKKHSLIYIVFVAALITLSDQISASLIKNWVQRPRPCHCQELAGMVHIVENHCGGAYGFVSSHASNVFALAVYVGLILKKTKAWILYLLVVWASLVAYSRIYLGVHYPGDVLGGAMLGGVSGYLMAWLSTNILNRYFQNKE